MTLYECAAHIDEHGKIVGGKAGDQTSHEVSVSSYSDYSPGGWDCVLRYTGKKQKKVRNRLMKAAYRLAMGNKVGYNQHSRTSLYSYMQAFKWYLKKIGKIKACNTDCSAFVTVCANIAGVPIRAFNALPAYIWTGSMIEEFTPRGFTKVKKGINFSTGKGLLPGDILLNELNHTSIFMGNCKSGQMYGIANSNDKEPANQTMSLDQVAEKVIQGEYGNGDERIKALEKLGFNANQVQQRVNELAKKYEL